MEHRFKHVLRFIFRAGDARVVHRKRKKFTTAPKVSSSGMTEQYVIPPAIEQLRGLPKSSVVVRNVVSNVRRSGRDIAQWIVNLRLRPC